MKTRTPSPRLLQLSKRFSSSSLEISPPPPALLMAKLAQIQISAADAANLMFVRTKAPVTPFAFLIMAFAHAPVPPTAALDAATTLSAKLRTTAARLS